MRSYGRLRAGNVRTVAALVAAATSAGLLTATVAGADPSHAGRSTGSDRAVAHIPAPSRDRGATVAGIVVGTEARSQPGAGRAVWWVGPGTNMTGEPQILLVLGSAYHRRREWLRVLLPIRPDGTTGWIPRDNVQLLRVRYWITVDKRKRTLTVYHDGLVMRRFDAIIGSPNTPTPDGLAAVYEVDPEPDPWGPVGPWALPLTSLSHVLFHFDGGPGRIAIHGRGPGTLQDPLGSARSHGCVRIEDGAVTWLAHHIPQGTPVQIG